LREGTLLPLHWLFDTSTTELTELQSYAAILQFALLQRTGCCFGWQLHFVHEKFNELNELYKSALPEEQKLLPWDSREATVKQVALALLLLLCG